MSRDTGLVATITQTRPSVFDLAIQCMDDRGACTGTEALIMTIDHPGGVGPSTCTFLGPGARQLVFNSRTSIVVMAVDVDDKNTSVSWDATGCGTVHAVAAAWSGDKIVVVRTGGPGTGPTFRVDRQVCAAQVVEFIFFCSFRPR